MRFHESMVLISLIRLSIHHIHLRFTLHSHRGWGGGGRENDIKKDSLYKAEQQNEEDISSKMEL